MHIKLAALISAVFVGFTFSAGGVTAGAVHDERLSWAELAVQGDWEKTYTALDASTAAANDPVARLLKAHACLATNRSNEALLLFISTADEDSARSWANWTHNLGLNNHQSAFATYLAADGQARLRNHQAADQLFSRAIEQLPDFAQARLARGVARIVAGRGDEGLLDLIRATEQGPHLSEAHASLGTYWIHREVPQEALKSFEKALAITPDAAMAHNGRGCAYFGLGRLDEGLSEMELALSACPTLIPALVNEGYLISALLESSDQGRAGARGTTLIAESHLERTDYASLSTMEEMQQFHASVSALGERDPVGAIRVLAIQSARLQVDMQRLSAEVAQYSEAAATAKSAAEDFRFLKEMTSFARQAYKSGTDWKQYRPKEAFLGVGYILGTGFSGVEFVAHSYADTAADIERLRATQLAVRARQHFDLQREQGRYLATAIAGGHDLGALITLPQPGRIKGPAPTLAISAEAPLAEFRTIPDSLAGVTSAVTQLTRSRPLVTVGGLEKLDPIRSLTLIAQIKTLGVDVMPSLTGGPAYVNALGADHHVQITNKGTRSQMPLGTEKSRPLGGVSMDMSHVHVDRGRWPVFTTFGLLYSPDDTD